MKYINNHVCCDQVKFDLLVVTAHVSQALRHHGTSSCSSYHYVCHAFPLLVSWVSSQCNARQDLIFITPGVL